MSLLMSRYLRVVMADQARGRLPLRLGSPEIRTEVREPNADHETGRVPVILARLMSRYCSASRLVQTAGKFPSACRSPFKLRNVSNVKADQEGGRLPLNPQPLSTLSETRVLTWPMAAGNGSCA